MSRFYPVFVIAITCAIALATSACSKPDDGKAPFAPQAGKAREIFSTEVVNTNLKVAAMGMDGTLTQTTRMNLLVTPGDASADGRVNVGIVFDYFDSQQTGALIEAAGDSMDMSAANKAIAKGLMGKSFTAEVDSGGSVLGINGTTALVDSVLAEMGVVEFSSEMGENANGLVEEIVSHQFGTDVMSNLVEYFVLPRSLEKLDPGATWSRTGEVVFGMMPAHATYTYTVTERTETEVVVEEAGTYEFDQNTASLISIFKSNPMMASLGEPTFELSGTGATTYSIDIASGWAKSCNGTIDLKGRFIVGPVNAEVNVTVAQDFTSNFK